MARDHRRLRVFDEAHQLILAIYKETQSFPRDEWFGMRAQIRRAAVSIASNIVEGSARRGAREYVHFVKICRVDPPQKWRISSLFRQNLDMFPRQRGSVWRQSAIGSFLS
jgi:hypothetical protein